MLTYPLTHPEASKRLPYPYLKHNFLATSMAERNVVCGIPADFSKESLKTGLWLCLLAFRKYNEKPKLVNL